MHPDQGYGVGANFYQEDDREMPPMARAQKNKKVITNIFNFDDERIDEIIKRQKKLEAKGDDDGK